VRYSSRVRLRALTFLLLVFASAARVAAQATPPAPPRFEDTVHVVGATPIPGLGIDRDKVPGHVQTATSEDLSRTRGIHPGEQISSAFASVQANDATTNPFQPDLQFRGFVASPLLGLPQGLAVYQDGVRMNEPFGDTVNWELLPANAIAGITLMPGSNPLFGLNALGGAVSLQTKTGFSHAGHTAGVSFGSFGRRWAEAQTAGSRGRMAYFVTGKALAENGWRDFSPSRVGQIFGNLEWRRETTTIAASVSGGNNRLIGNGAVPVQLLDEDRDAIFTHPDESKTNALLFSGRVRHTISPTTSVDAVLFYRPTRVRTFNGDDTDYDECEDAAFEQLLCTEDGGGDPLEDQLGNLVPVDDDNPFDGTNNRSSTRTHGWGGGLQATVTRPVSGRANQFIVGVSVDGARSRYESDTELARLTDSRGTVGTGIFDEDAAVRLRTSVRHTSLYVADFFDVTPRLTVSGSARFNHSAVDLHDQLGDDLTGAHRFSRVNPAGGFTYQFPQRATFYGSVSLASRVPAPSELSCADPEDPCRLPNAFVSDPPLEEVVTRTLEGGLRGNARGIDWNASAFRSSNDDDIIFISSGALTNTGHFANVGSTLRQGIELTAAGAVSPAVRWRTAYSYLRAQFDRALTLSSPNHPDEDDGQIEVEAGDSIPGVPRHNLKADVMATLARLSLGGSVAYTSSHFLRGDEANLLPAVPGAAMVGLTAGFSLHQRVRITGRVTNLFNRQYETFGLLGEADEVLGDDYDDPRFLSPAAPRAAWVGVEVGF
jgi:iron complex outermembrane receptor protein